MKTMRRLAAILTVGAMVSGAFGDDTVKVAAAAGALKDGGTLKLEKREYRLTAKDAKGAVRLVGRKNVTIDGNGATVVVEGSKDACAFLLEGCEGVTVRNLNVKGAPGTAFTVRSCARNVTFEGCSFAEVAGDAIDVNGAYFGVAAFDGTNMTVKALQTGFLSLSRGDELFFLDPKNRGIASRGTVKDVTAAPANAELLTFTTEKPLSRSLKEDFLVENRSLQPTLAVRSCRFANGGGLALASCAVLVVENNRFENLKSALRLFDDPALGYGGLVDDLAVCGNTFIDCNALGGDAVISIDRKVGGKHQRVLLENNRYEKLTKDRILAKNITDLVDRDEKIVPVATYYVSPTGDDFAEGTAKKPLKTIRQAVRLARERKADGYRRIVIGDGVYRVDDHPVLINADNGNLIIEAEHTGKVLLTGAEKVTDWTADPEDSRFLVAKLPFEPKPEMLYMLTVGGENADLAAFPEYGGENKMPYLASPEDAWTGNKTVLKYDSHYLPKGRDFRDLDLDSVWLTIPQEWATTRSYIATNDWQHDTFCLKTPAHMALGTFNKGFQLVNLRLGMRHPGMWMFEAKKGRLVYWPKEGQCANNLDASVSRAVSAFTISAARNVTIRGLVIEALAAPFSERTAPKGTPAPWAIQAAGGHGPGSFINLLVENCEIRNCAGAGIHVQLLKDCRIRKNHVHHMGGMGIGCHGASTHNAVLHNHVHHCGLFDTSAPQIGVHSAYSEYVGNHVHDGPRDGFTMWSSHSVFASNHIHHVMKSSRDGGGLYGGYSFTTLKDNYVHDTGNWPGLYNDEGGMKCVFTGNRFEGLWWPFHMHDTYEIVVTNNTMTYDGGMRFSFMGSVHCVFSNNLIRTSLPITEDPYLENCDVWMDNRIEMKQADGTYKPSGRLTLPKQVKGAKKPACAYRAAGPGIVNGNVDRGNCRARWSRFEHIDRSAEGWHTDGVPGASFFAAFDGNNLYLGGSYDYNKLVTYRGARSLGHFWGESDGVRFYFKDFDIALFFDGTAVASGLSFVATTNNFVGKYVGGTGCGRSEFGVAIPLAKLGLTGDAEGEEIPFNAVFYNGDHKEFRYYEKPDGKNLLTAKLKFVPYDPDHAGQVGTTFLADADGMIVPGAMSPCGKVQVDLETVYRPCDDYGETQGYRPRNAYMMGYTYRDRSDAKSAGRRAFLVQPFTGDDPKSGARRAQRMEQSSESAKAGFYGVNLQDWDLWTKAVATERVFYHDFLYWRGGAFKVLVDTNFADGKVTDEESSVLPDGTLVARIRVKAGLLSSYYAYGKFAFNRKPVAVRELPLEDGAVGKRYLFEFLLPPATGHVILRGAVSEKSAEDAAAAFASDPAGFDFDARAEDARLAWEKILGPVDADGEFKARRAFVTALYGAYVQPEGKDGKTYRVRLGDEHATVRVTGGAVTTATRLVTAKVNGQPVADLKKIAKDFLKPGDVLTLELNKTKPTGLSGTATRPGRCAP